MLPEALASDAQCMARFECEPQRLAVPNHPPYRRDGEGTIRSEPLPPHTLENVGESELRAISVELKNSK